MAQAIRTGFKALYQRNEYAHQLTDEKLRSLIVEVTGKEKTASVVSAIAGSFKACKALADFNFNDSAKVLDEVYEIKSDEDSVANSRSQSFVPAVNTFPQKVGMSFGYTINLNLPDTDDPKVFNAIFSALKDTLLRD